MANSFRRTYDVLVVKAVADETDYENPIKGTDFLVVKVSTAGCPDYVRVHEFSGDIPRELAERAIDSALASAISSEALNTLGYNDKPEI